jgi:hypothetical protein
MFSVSNIYGFYLWPYNLKLKVFPNSANDMTNCFSEVVSFAF